MIKKKRKVGESNGKRLSRALAERLCGEVAQGVPLTRACRAEGVRVDVVFKWLQRGEETRQLYARACETRLQVLEERVLELCVLGHEAALEEMTGKERLTAIKLEIDTLKWMLSKLMRRKYGEKQVVELTGKDGKDFEVKRDVDMEALKQMALWKAEFERRGDDEQG